jgi:hypothetical protein
MGCGWFGLWIMSLSITFQLYLEKTRPVVTDEVVSTTPRHVRDSNLQC